MEWLVGVIAILSVFGFPTAAVYLRQRHKERMQALQVQPSARRVAELEAARSDLEARVRTLESIVTAGDQDLEMRLRQLTSSGGTTHQARIQGRQG